MPRATWMQTSFNSGEWSPLMYGRADLPKRKNAMSQCTNYVPTVQGPLVRRPGTAYVYPAANSQYVRLLPFEFSTTQAYILEFTPGFIGFYTNGGRLLSGGAPYYVATNYAGPDLQTLYITQSDDILYITHPNYPPMMLQRLGATSWTFTPIAFSDGPYLDINVTTTKMSLTSVVIGASTTLTATATLGINNGAGFQASDVGRLVRVNNLTTGANVWVWVIITAVTNSLNATVTVQGIPP